MFSSAIEYTFFDDSRRQLLFALVDLLSNLEYSSSEALKIQPILPHYYIIPYSWKKAPPTAALYSANSIRFQ